MPVEILMSQNTVLEFPILIINYCVFINVFYNFNFIINSSYYYISNEVLPEDYDKEENM